MIIRRPQFDKYISLLSATGEYALDTETTGLRAYHEDRLFSVIIADETKSYYFNFQNYPGLLDEWVLPREWLPRMAPIFDNPDTRWYLANAKFDMGMLAREGLFLAGHVHCTEAIGRVEKNNRIKYGLASLVEPLGLTKSDAVEDYIKKEGLWEWQTIPGKEKRVKKKYFDQVPFQIIQPYAERDAEITRALGKHQEKELACVAQGTAENCPTILQVAENERRFTKTCFRMEQVGLLIDRKYCERALAYEESRIEKLKTEFKELTGLEFQDARSTLETAFRNAGEEIPRTDKGNPSFNDEALRRFTSPAAGVVRAYRDSFKKANTYYRNLLYYADGGGSIHPSIRQGGTGTGRVSCTEPNLQNLPDEEDEENQEFPVRRAFIPRPHFFFFMPDYEQMEYRMMLDYARQMDVIDQVKQGSDIHDATAQIINGMLGLNITRKEAKTLNFGLLYGMGIDALAESLKTTREQAGGLKQAYFQALPFVKGFIRRVVNRAETTGYIFNWYGRRSYFDQKEFCYKAPNYLIQGGCADVVKVAMNRIDDFLKGRKSRMLMQVHDEIIFEIHETESQICGELMGIMAHVYPYRHLSLTCSAEHSHRSWGDKVKGFA